MAYIGNIPADKYQTLQKQSFTTSATDTYTLDYAVTNPQDLGLFINNVRQNPNDAYTVSGTTLTLSSAITGSDTMYAVFLGRAVETVAPAIGSVTNSMLANSSITLNGSAVSLGGSASVENTPFFRAYMNGDQEVSTATLTTIQINTVVFQTGSTFNTGTYIWTPAVAGKYYIYAKMAFNETTDFDFDEFGIRTTEENEISRSRGGNIRKDTFVNEVIADLSATEGVYLTCYQQTGSSQTINGNSLVTTFGGYKLIGA